ncbi:TolC family protein [Lysobacter pythonis]|uniref:TolC family protein n=1 Tax=Solilutibacter pythonis TaxID=2483112 RepID=A0A3M2HU63_9GAMM|nr:TolC family protein [Lysobacter pythonis]RMH90949.1 TolC family protein [Lysobacter pythonis]
MLALSKKPLLAAALAVALTASALPIRADDGAGATAPSYESLLARLDTLPASVESEALSEAALGRAQQARAYPNPSLAVERANVFGTGQYRGVGSGETTLSVNQPLELWGKRGARIQAARAEANAAGLRSVQMRWLTAGRLAAAYAEAEAALRRYELAREALLLTEQDANGVAALVREGREARLREVQAQAELESARAALDEASAARDAALAQLTALAMLEQPVERLSSSLLDRMPAGPAKDDQAEPLSVQVAQAELSTADRLVTVERRRALPDVSASVGVRRFNENSDRALTLGLNLSIPVFDRNTGNIRAAYAERRAAEARLAARKQEARAERLAATAALSASTSRARAADSGVATATEAYRLARIGFEAGRISQLELRSSRTALVSARGDAVDARVARVMAEIELARVEGRTPFGDAR